MAALSAPGHGDLTGQSFAALDQGRRPLLSCTAQTLCLPGGRPLLVQMGSGMGHPLCPRGVGPGTLAVYSEGSLLVL